MKPIERKELERLARKWAAKKATAAEVLRCMDLERKAKAGLADLIANETAAPELVEALRRAVNHLLMDIDRNGRGIHSTDTPNALSQARAALAKAGC